jgi:chlorobactene glucosyltransferase
VVLLNIFQNPKLKPAPAPMPCPRLSVLIPARNEAGVIGSMLARLRDWEWPGLEVLVLDDDSSDGTGAEVAAAMRRDGRVRLLRGQPLPGGWLGKNWACRQLAQAAQGDFLLFLDADVQAEPGLPGALLAEMERHGLALASVFPDQRLGSWGERAVVPIMHELLLGLLPLRWVRTMPFPSMAAANGQVMFFRAETYRQKQFHEKARKEIVEDIAIARSVKQEGLKAGTYLGNGLVRARMYGGYAEAVAGFGKNLLAGFGNSLPGMFFYIVSVSVAYGGLLALPMGWWVLAGGCWLATNGGLAWLSSQPAGLQLLTSPLRAGVYWQVGWASALRRFRKQNLWKGRNVHIGR